MLWVVAYRTVLCCNRFGAGGHPKAAAASVRLHSDDPEKEARQLIDGVVDTMCQEQVGKSELFGRAAELHLLLKVDPTFFLRRFV